MVKLLKSKSKSKARLKAKTPGRSKAPRRTRTFWLELLFFLALAVFGFSVVQSLLGAEGSPILALQPVINLGGVEEVQAAGLYEAPSSRPVPESDLSPIFTPSVQYWKDDIIVWVAEYGLDPNLAATVMQIESCGYPRAGSHVGALGLFQVMPYHFEDDDDPFDPDTNALRGLAYLAGGLERADGHAGLALAGYNGGYLRISGSYATWPYETQRYYRWGSGIYREASAGWDSSPTLAAWLAAGGQSLCDTAEQYLDITSEASAGG